MVRERDSVPCPGRSFATQPNFFCKIEVPCAMWRMLGPQQVKRTNNVSKGTDLNTSSVGGILYPSSLWPITRSSLYNRSLWSERSMPSLLFCAIRRMRGTKGFMKRHNVKSSTNSLSEKNVDIWILKWLVMLCYSDIHI